MDDNTPEKDDTTSSNEEISLQYNTPVKKTNVLPLRTTQTLHPNNVYEQRDMSGSNTSIMNEEMYINDLTPYLHHCMNEMQYQFCCQNSCYHLSNRNVVQYLHFRLYHEDVL